MTCNSFLHRFDPKAIFLCICLCTVTTSVIFDCEFTFESRVIIGKVYHCRPSVDTTESKNTLEGVTGEHLSGYSNEDVQYVFLENQNLSRIPSNIESFFPKLLGIEWYNSNLLTVSAADLASFSSLQVLSLYKNKLTSVDGDLFTSTPNLRWISFSNNNIRYVGPDLLTELSDLEYIDFRSNICINKLARTTQEIEEMKLRLLSQCAPPTTLEPTTTLTPTTEISEECPGRCMQQIESSHGEMMKLIDKINEQEEVISQLYKANEEFKEKFEKIEAQLRELTESPGSSC